VLFDFLQLLLHYGITIIPAFLVALLISAILVEFIPDWVYERILGSNQFLFILLASFVGALIPICTCGMIPLAGKLHKKGASWLIVVAFLTAGNASSITSLIMTLVMGTGITFGRFIFAVVFGLLVSYIFVLIFKPKSLLSENGGHSDNITLSKKEKITNEFVILVKNFGPWVIAAVLIAAFISLFLSYEFVVSFAGVGNTFAPFVFGVVGFPFYFCAGADIPISSALLAKGAGLGSILSFMTASPGVNLTTLLIYQKWLGLKNSIIYLIISVLICGTLGMIVNFFMLPISPYPFS